jgi:hypothetical protein
MRLAPLYAALLGGLIALPAVGRATPLDAGGFSSTGTLVVQATVSGSPFDVGGNIALFRRGSMYRLDLLSLGFPGTGAQISAAAGALIAPGGATLVYDGRTGVITAYSNANHVYYQDGPKQDAAKLAAPRTPAAPPTAAGAADPLAALAGIVAQLRDVQRASIQLTGHSTTNGHPTDDLDVLVKRQRPGKALEDYHAQLELADDLDGFPVRILLSSTPPTPQDFGGSLRLDLTSVERATPDDRVFAIPPGYTRVASIGEVLQAAH